MLPHSGDIQALPHPCGGGQIKDHASVLLTDVFCPIIGILCPRQGHAEGTNTRRNHGKILPEILSQLGEQGLVSVEQEDTALGKSPRDLQLGAGDILSASQILQVGRPDIGDHGDIGADGRGHGGDLATAAHAHLQDGAIRIGRDLHKGQGQSNGAVEVSVLLEKALAAGEDGSGHFLGGGLAYATRNGYHRKVVHGLSVGSGQYGQGVYGVLHQDIRGRGRILGQPLTEEHRAAQGGGLLYVVVSVHPLAADGAEQGMLIGLAGIGADMGDRGVCHPRMGQATSRHEGQGRGGHGCCKGDLHGSACLS